MAPIRGIRPINFSKSLFLRHPPIRSFHASPSRKYLEPLITSTHTALEAIHSTTGLPWAYTIPLFALSLRMTILLPLTIYSRRALQRQAELAPLLFAWSHNIRAQTLRKSAPLGVEVVKKQSQERFSQKRKELYKRWGCSAWMAWIPAGQLPVFLVAVETIRRMCGTRQGLLGMIFSTSTPEAAESTALSTSASIIGIEPTFATEGALWFPNLLLPDPELYLPWMLGAVMMGNIAPWKVNSSTEPWRRRLTRGMGMVALCLPILALKMPAAILVYWISSSGCSLLQNVILNKVMPVKPKVLPCKPNQKVDS